MKKNINQNSTDPIKFDQIVREIFAPIYPVIAEQIIKKTTCHSGICLDVGCGTGALGRAFGQLTSMELVFFDKSKEMLHLCKKYVYEENLSDRSSFIQGDIHSIPCDDESVDLVISRGSSPFWEDWNKAYSEIFRILKKGGKLYIGGGFGTRKLKDEIVSIMMQNDPEWNNSFKDRVVKERQKLPSILKHLNSESFEIINDDSGFWVYLIK